MRILFILLLLIACTISQAQQTVISRQDSALKKFRNDYPQEKVYVQTDKLHYASGETIWMKAWTQLEESPGYLSKVLYIDLVDKTGKVIQKKMFQLDSLGSTAADFELPLEIKSGNYSINAYTLWMLNFPEFIFHKDIFIYGDDYLASRKKVSVNDNKPKLQVHFFPESGNLVKGILNRVAFKATDQHGYPVTINASLQDQSGKKLLDFVSEHDGMGSFEFTPETETPYNVFVGTGSGAQLQFKLPAAKPEGISLRVENSSPSRIFILLNRAEQNKANYDRVKVVAQINYQPVYAAQLNIEAGENAFSIPKKGLPAGILQITVFNINDIPLAERITFIENYKLLEPSINKEQVSFNAKGKNLVNFGIEGNKPVALSAVVSRYEPGDSNYNRENIASTFLATSELKGYVHDPGYYFKNKQPSTLRHLDLLLMTQGWRRFSWKKIIDHDFAKLSFPVESAISFRGTLYKSGRKEAIPDGRVSFIIKSVDSTSILGEARVTDKGEFLLPDVYYRKSASVSYMGTNNKKEKLIADVNLLPNYIDTLKTSAFKPLLNLDTAAISLQQSAMNKYLNSKVNYSDTFNNAKILGGVVVKAKRLSREDSLNVEYATGLFRMGKNVDPEAFKYYQTIWQMIQAAVPGVTVEGNPYDPVVSFNRFGGLGNNTLSTDPNGDDLSVGSVMESNGIAYFLNESNVSKDIINTLSIEDVAFIKVLKTEAGALGASQGAIAVYTKKGISGNKSVYDKSYITETMQGFAIVRDYYSPDYSIPENLKTEDNRYTLYWNGKLTPAKDGKYRFRFFNNDAAKTFKLVVQGMTKEGEFVFGEYIIE